MSPELDDVIKINVKWASEGIVTAVFKGTFDKIFLKECTIGFFKEIS